MLVGQSLPLTVVGWGDDNRTWVKNVANEPSISESFDKFKSKGICAQLWGILSCYCRQRI